jgi:ankyrin repeat protein
MRMKILCLFCLAAVSAMAADTRVADAAMNRDSAAVKTLLKQKADVNVAQGDGMTALHWATMNNDLDTVNLLLAAGADVKAATRNGGVTPLFTACTNGNAPLIAALLKAGADANSVTTYGTTALMLAASSGSSEAVTALLDKGANVNAKDTAHGQTALMYASAENRPAVIKTLLARGADTKVTSTVTRLGRVLIDDNGNPIEPTPPPAARPATPAPAAAKPATTTAKVDSKFDGAALARPDRNGSPGARMGGNSATVMGGLAALSYAARDGRIEAVQTLVEGGADVNQVTGSEKSTPMVLALINGHYDVAKYLLDRGADPNIANIDGLAPLYALVDMRFAVVGWVPNPKTDREKIDGLDLMKALIAKGANVNQRLVRKLWFRPNTHNTQWINSAGATPFWRAAESSDVDAMRVLIASGADPEIATLDGDSPLIVATGIGWAAGQSQNAPGKWMETIKFLVEGLQTDVNAHDFSDYTPLHGAAFRGDNEMVQYLVDHGAAPSLAVKSNRGQAPSDMANGPIVNADLPIEHPDTVALLVKLGSPPPSVFGPNHR